MREPAGRFDGVPVVTPSGVRAGRELFVYYRVAASTWHEAAAAARTAQACLRQSHPGLSARLLRRPDERGGEVTLMEVYADVARGIDDALAAQIEAAAQALNPWLLSPRHCERFDALG